MSLGSYEEEISVCCQVLEHCLAHNMYFLAVSCYIHYNTTLLDSSFGFLQPVLDSENLAPGGLEGLGWRPLE